MGTHSSIAQESRVETRSRSVDFLSLSVTYSPPMQDLHPRDLQMSVGEQQTVDHTTRQIHKCGLPKSVLSTMPGHRQRQHRTVYRQRTYTQTGQKLKFLTSPGIEPGPPGWKEGLYRPRINFKFLKSRVHQRYPLHRRFLLKFDVYTVESRYNLHS